MTVLDFARKIKALTGSDSEIVFEPRPENDPMQRRPEISKAKKLLGWEPEIGLDEGLKLTIEWFGKNISSGT
jgi:nucleoside-diphosphate-sugar epimerase